MGLEPALSPGVPGVVRVSKGDLVLIYPPMIPRAVIAIVECARIYDVHSVVSAGIRLVRHPENSRRGPTRETDNSLHCKVEAARMILFR